MSKMSSQVEPTIVTAAPPEGLNLTSKDQLAPPATERQDFPSPGAAPADLPFELRLKVYHLNLTDHLKLENMTSNSIHVRPTDLNPPSDVFPSFSTCPLDWTRTIETKPEHPIREPAVSRTARLVRADVLPLLYKPDTPTSYTFHACPAAQIRNTLHRIHNEDISLGLRLENLTFCLPKAIDDQGLATIRHGYRARDLLLGFHRVLTK
ncbi:unnamed protein product [Aureobasidium pullulans]|nr:unnamed protein product [Aureobasidium pullulans]